MHVSYVLRNVTFEGEKLEFGIFNITFVEN